MRFPARSGQATRTRRSTRNPIAEDLHRTWCFLLRHSGGWGVVMPSAGRFRPLAGQRRHPACRSPMVTGACRLGSPMLGSQPEPASGVLRPSLPSVARRSRLFRRDRRMPDLLIGITPSTVRLAVFDSAARLVASGRGYCAACCGIAGAFPEFTRQYRRPRQGRSLALVCWRSTTCAGGLPLAAAVCGCVLAFAAVSLVRSNAEPFLVFVIGLPRCP